MIHVTMMKGFSRIHNRELTEKQSRKIGRAMKAYRIHERNMKTTYVDAPMKALQLVSPFDNVVPVIPWL